MVLLFYRCSHPGWLSPTWLVFLSVLKQSRAWTLYSRSASGEGDHITCCWKTSLHCFKPWYSQTFSHWRFFCLPEHIPAVHPYSAVLHFKVLPIFLPGKGGRRSFQTRRYGCRNRAWYAIVVWAREQVNYSCILYFSLSVLHIKDRVIPPRCFAVTSPICIQQAGMSRKSTTELLLDSVVWCVREREREKERKERWRSE